MKTVRFTRRQWPYQAGEIAGFEASLAERYVEDGAAEFYPAAAPVEPNSAMDAALVQAPESPATGPRARRRPMRRQSNPAA